MSIKYELKSFEQLSLQELYQILKLRQEVFVVEQNCPYLDADGKDIYSHHVLGMDENGEILCYARLIPEGISYEGFCSIGRVVNAEKIRNTGQGLALMQYAIKTIHDLFPNTPIKIGGQAYLKNFYEGLGFEDLGQPYLEDGIPHLIMVLN